MYCFYHWRSLHRITDRYLILCDLTPIILLCIAVTVVSGKGTTSLAERLDGHNHCFSTGVLTALVNLTLTTLPRL